LSQSTSSRPAPHKHGENSNNTELPAGFNPEQIFEPFTRLAPEKFSENGLSLTVETGIVKNHGER